MMREFGSRLIAVIRDGFRIWWLAPLIPLVAALPEFAQHVAEIQLGMFDSREAAQAIGNSDTRWAFGYVKLAGYFVAILLAIRFWSARGEGTPWWSPKGVAWRVFGFALLLNLAVSFANAGIGLIIAGKDPRIGEAAGIVVSILTLPVVVLLVAGLVGDKKATVARAYRHGWMAALRIGLFSAVVLAPLMWLHGQNHAWAMGQPGALVWALMVFDSLVVGLLAAGWGTAIHHGYRPVREKIQSTPVSAATA